MDAVLPSVTTAQRRSSPAIRVEAVSHAFAAAGGEPTLALDNISFDVPKGQFLALVGASGCGKTTILNMAAGLIQPVTGQVVVNGERVLRPSRRTGYMFARDGLLPWRSARRNIEVGLELRGVPAGERGQRSDTLLDMIGLGAFGHALPRQLSQGMRQRVALARTLAIDPETLLMDEPFAALDAQTKLLLQAEFLRIWERDRKTVLFVTHDLPEAVALADRVIVLTRRPGRVQADIAIDLPRPRDPERIRFDQRFLDLNQKVWQALKQGEAAP